MTALLQLRDRRHRLSIAPDLGGGIAEAMAIVDGAERPILRPWAGAEAGLLGLGCNLLVPFSNRISRGGFHFDGAFHPLTPNLPGEAYPIHGDGFQAVWTVEQVAAEHVELTHDGGFGPFRYSARMRYALEDDAITLRLSMTNRGPRLPFGGGFHPWFPRHPGTRLGFAAAGVWDERPDHLPDRHHMLTDLPAFDFRDIRPLPETWINAVFTGWQGPARIEQPALGLALDLNASKDLDCAVVYSPDKDAGFFCFEPVSHPVDAHNMDGMPGLTVLERDETLELDMRLAWSKLESS